MYQTLRPSVGGVVMTVTYKACVACGEQAATSEKLAPAISLRHATRSLQGPKVTFSFRRDRIHNSPLILRNFNSNPQPESNVPRDGPCSVQKPAAISAHRFPRYAEPPTPQGYDLTWPIAGDANVLSAARVEVRKNFETNRQLQTGSEELQKEIARANEVAKFLRENVVQGEATEGDNYSTQWTALTLLVYILTETARNQDTRAHRARRQRGYQEEQGQVDIRGNEVLLLLIFCHASKYDTHAVHNANPMLL